MSEATLSVETAAPAEPFRGSKKRIGWRVALGLAPQIPADRLFRLSCPRIFRMNAA